MYLYKQSMEFALSWAYHKTFLCYELNANFLLDNDFQAMNPQNLTDTFETYYKEAESEIEDERKTGKGSQSPDMISIFESDENYYSAVSHNV